MYSINNLNLFKSHYQLTKEVERKAKALIKKTPLNVLIDKGETVDDMFYEMECDTQFDPLSTDENYMVRCKDKEIIRSLQKYGTCFTYFHELALFKHTDKKDCKFLRTCSKSLIIK